MSHGLTDDGMFESVRGDLYEQLLVGVYSDNRGVVSEP